MCLYGCMVIFKIPRASSKNIYDRKKILELFFGALLVGQLFYRIIILEKSSVFWGITMWGPQILLPYSWFFTGSIWKVINYYFSHKKPENFIRFFKFLLNGLAFLALARVLTIVSFKPGPFTTYSDWDFGYFRNRIMFLKSNGSIYTIRYNALNLQSAHRMCFCVSYSSYNKDQLFL
jgi:hypothetical protein